MIKRIRELEKQATETVKCGLNGASTTESFNRKKFAELIVKECCEVIDAGKIGYNQVPAEAALDLTSKNVKAYFGITDE